MSNHIYHYTYEITNKKNSKTYIGVRSSRISPYFDPYYGSSHTLNRRVIEEGIENFDKKILQLFPTREEAMQHEVDLHELYDVAKNPRFYNEAKQTTTKFSYDPTGKKCTEEHKRKVSEAKMGNKCGVGNTNHLGHKHTEEAKKKMSKPKSEETKMKMSKSKRNMSEETKRKMSIAKKLYWAQKKKVTTN